MAEVQGATVFTTAPTKQPEANETGVPAPTTTKCWKRDEMEPLNILKHPVWVFDVERKCMWWANQSALEIWKAGSLHELLQRDFASDMTEETNTRMLDHLARMKRGEVMKEQWTYYPNGAKSKTLQVAGSAIWISDNENETRAAVLAEAELPDHAHFHDSTAREVELLRHCPMSVCQFDMKGNPVFRNPEDLRVFGVSNSKNNNDNKQGLIERFVDPSVGTTLLQKVKEGQDYRVEAEQYAMPTRNEKNDTDDPTPRWFTISVRRSKDPVTSSDCILYSARDISEILKAQEATRKANLKSEFMSVIAHEIRTPLHQIVGYTDLLELTELPDRRQVEAVKMIQRSLDNLMAILNDLLDYNKYESGKTELETLHFSLPGLLKGCTTVIQSEAVVKGLSVQLDLHPDLPSKVVGDPNKLRQIILNLLVNSNKFTSQGHIKLSARALSIPDEGTDQDNGTPPQQEQMLRFEVSDTGIGIPRTHLAVIFEKYAKVNAHNALNCGGTGLGLSICKVLVEAMGGEIGVESEVDKGTTFYFEIPFGLPQQEETKKECAAKSEEKTSDTLMSPNESLRILVVEDNKVNQKLLTRMLTRMGHTVTVAENGQVALDKLEGSTTPTDIVLMDIQMPVMDGIEATKVIRMTRSKLALPIVALSASFQNADLETYLEIGMNQCLSKPVRMETLKRTIDKTIENCMRGRGSL